MSSNGNEHDEIMLTEISTSNQKYKSLPAGDHTEDTDDNTKLCKCKCKCCCKLIDKLSIIHQQNSWLIAMFIVIIDAIFTLIAAVYGFIQHSNDSTWIFYIQTIGFSSFIAIITIYTITMVIFAESIEKSFSNHNFLHFNNNLIFHIFCMDK